jgi:hypothetical protein
VIVFVSVFVEDDHEPNEPRWNFFPYFEKLGVSWIVGEKENGLDNLSIMEISAASTYPILDSARFRRLKKIKSFLFTK